MYIQMAPKKSIKKSIKGGNNCSTDFIVGKAYKIKVDNERTWLNLITYTRDYIFKVEFLRKEDNINIFKIKSATNMQKHDAFYFDESNFYDIVDGEKIFNKELKIYCENNQFYFWQFESSIVPYIPYHVYCTILNF